uniref:Reverse transcriptase domain-containing protein n=3 Tax=Lygus hesperus TaxID=30085 RepID=A0A0A9YYN0_LYGHE
MEINKKITRDYFKENQNLITVKTDKTKQIAIMKRDQYDAKMIEILHDKHSFKESTIDPTKVVNAKVEKYVNKMIENKCINKRARTKYFNAHSTSPLIYGLLKNHLPEPYPMRPIVSTINSPTRNLSVFFNNILKPVALQNPYDVKNAAELKKFLEKAVIPPTYRIYSFDVTNMFPSLNINTTIKIIKSKWDKIKVHSPIKNLDVFIEGIKLVCCNGYNRFKDKYYIQLKGMENGSVISTSIASLTMTALLEQILKNTEIHVPFAFKYVDDVLLACDAEQVDHLLDMFNSYDKHFKFTKEDEDPNNKSISFLDMTIIRQEDGSFKFKHYTKLCASECMINFYSNHPLEFKKNLVYNLAYNALLRTSAEYEPDVKSKLTKKLILNNYPNYIINQQYKRAWRYLHYSTNDRNAKEEVFYNTDLFDFDESFFKKMKKVKINEEGNRVYKYNQNETIALKTRITDYFNVNQSMKNYNYNLHLDLQQKVTNQSNNDKNNKQRRYIAYNYHPKVQKPLETIFKKQSQEFHITWKYNNKIKNLLTKPHLTKAQTT